MKLEIIIAIMFAHFIGDFVLQTDQMAQGKRASNYWLLVHVSCYMVPIYICSVFVIDSIWFGLLWTLLNTSIHFGQDWLTSRLNFWLKQKSNHLLFVGIGFDQLMHYIFLFSTLQFTTHSH